MGEAVGAAHHDGAVCFLYVMVHAGTPVTEALLALAGGSNIFPSSDRTLVNFTFHFSVLYDVTLSPDYDPRLTVADLD